MVSYMVKVTSRRMFRFIDSGNHGQLAFNFMALSLKRGKLTADNLNFKESIALLLFSQKLIYEFTALPHST